MAGATERKKAAILVAARRLYAERGMGGTSIEAIAESAGVSRQTVYTYYGTKEQILAEILTQFFREGTADWREARPRAGPIETRGHLEDELADFMSAAISMLMQPDYLDIVRVIIGEARRNPLVGALFRQAVPEAMMAAAGRVFDRIPTAHRAPLSPEALLRVTVGSLLPYVLLDGLFGGEAIRRPSDQEVRELAAVVAAAVWT